MEKPTCRTCPYWDKADCWVDNAIQHDDEPNAEFIARAIDEGLVRCECHRFPPAILSRQQRDEQTCSSDYPVTIDFEWCGEHPDFPAYIESLKTSVHSGRIAHQPPVAPPVDSE